MTRVLRIIAAVLAMILAVAGAQASPGIWIGPEPPTPLGSQSPTGGSIDYVDFLTDVSRWKGVAGIVHTIQLSSSWVEKVASTSQLTLIAQNMKRNHINVAFGIEGLLSDGRCHGPGYAPRDQLIPLEKYRKAGGEISFVIFDEPFAWASGPRATSECRKTTQQVAKEIGDLADRIRSQFPGVKIGDVEPLWHDLSSTQIIQWLDDYAAQTHSNFDLFNLDIDFTRQDWAEEARKIEDAVHQRGVPFGMHYFGNRSDETDLAWLTTTAMRADRYEVELAGKPDYVMFDSWHPRPRYLLPEVDANTFTGLVWRYSLARKNDKRLIDDYPAPRIESSAVANAPRRIEIVGTVPSDARLAVVGLSFDRRCSGCYGPARLTLSNLNYSELTPTGTRRDPVALPLNTLSLSGDGALLEKAQPSKKDSLGVEISGASDVSIVNSRRIPVVPGARFIVGVDVEIDTLSQRGDSFRIVFLNERREISKVLKALRDQH